MNDEKKPKHSKEWIAWAISLELRVEIWSLRPPVSPIWPLEVRHG